jgi:NhaP-type Na+/H+ or K+/H+ antiporter
MGWELAVIAAATIGFALVSGRLEGTSITPAIFFVGVGLLFGTEALGVFDLPPTGESVKVLAEATLALVLFTDASRIDLRTLRREHTLPVRLLGVGLPLTIVAGGLLAGLLFGSLSVAEALVLGVMLAPTDAALGQPVLAERGGASPAVSHPPRPQRRKRPQRRHLRTAAVHYTRFRRGRGGQDRRRARGSARV